MEFNMQEWIRICEEYDELSDEERSQLSFEDFCKQNGYPILKEAV